jgi:hypothetical protein
MKVRRIGGGRKALKEKYPDIAAEIERIVSGSTFENPENSCIYDTKRKKDKAGTQRKRI